MQLKTEIFYPLTDDLCFKHIFSKEEILKDFLNSFLEFMNLEKVTLNTNEKPSVFRNIQDNILIDRVRYTHKKIGEAQAQGLMSQIMPQNNQNVASTSDIEKAFKDI